MSRGCRVHGCRARLRARSTPLAPPRGTFPRGATGSSSGAGRPPPPSSSRAARGADRDRRRRRRARMPGAAGRMTTGDTRGAIDDGAVALRRRALRPPRSPLPARSAPRARDPRHRRLSLRTALGVRSGGRAPAPTCRAPATRLRCARALDLDLPGALPRQLTAPAESGPSRSTSVASRTLSPMPAPEPTSPAPAPSHAPARR